MYLTHRFTLNFPANISISDRVAAQSKEEIGGCRAHWGVVGLRVSMHGVGVSENRNPNGNLLVR